MLQAVREAERLLLEEEQTKDYLGPSGNEQFNAAVTALVLGQDHPALRDGRLCTIQAPGGCGALRIGAELLAAARAHTPIHISDPSWANHVPLLAGANLRLGQYPYYDAASGAVKFDAMLERIRMLPAGDVVLLHGCCHNPTGAELSLGQWQALTDLFVQRSLVPFIDMAYQGLGEDLHLDAAGARLLARSVPDALIAVSASKNFGLYRERVGALIVIAREGRQVEAAATHLRKIARGLYSMPPDHGAAIVARILGDRRLDALWREELLRMRERISWLRLALAAALRKTCQQRDFSAIARQRGLFSMLDLTPAAVARLREDHHIYMAGNGRVNIGGLRHDNIDYVARAVATVLATVQTT